ncbi:hypothetical protein KEM55_002392 [Ascosphaera atra]|nr:hypothetical protein KEM55_002392 [Ascosphaera atra]
MMSLSTVEQDSLRVSTINNPATTASVQDLDQNNPARCGNASSVPQSPVAVVRPPTGEGEEANSPSFEFCQQQQQQQQQQRGQDQGLMNPLPVFQFIGGNAESRDGRGFVEGDCYNSRDITSADDAAAGQLDTEGARQRRLFGRPHRKSFSGFSTGFRHGVHEIANAARRLSTNIRGKHSHIRQQPYGQTSAAATARAAPLDRDASLRPPLPTDTNGFFGASTEEAVPEGIDERLATTHASPSHKSVKRRSSYHNAPIRRVPEEPTTQPSSMQEQRESDNHTTSPRPEAAGPEETSEDAVMPVPSSSSPILTPSFLATPLPLDSAHASTSHTPAPQPARTPAPTAADSPALSLGSRLGSSGDSKIFESGNNGSNGYLSVTGLKQQKPGWHQDAESGIDMGMTDIERVDEGVEENAYGCASEGKGKEVDVIRKDPATYLPAELFSQILSLLGAESLKEAELVSRAWYVQASSHHVWREVFRRQYQYHTYAHKPTTQSASHGAKVSTLTQTTSLGLGRSRPNQDWKKMYSVRHNLEQRWKDGKAAAIYLHGHTDSVYCVQFDENKIITGSRDRTIRVWNAHFPWNCIKVIGSPADVRANANAMQNQVVNGHGQHQQNNNNNNGQGPANMGIPPTTVVVNPSNSPNGKSPFMSLCPPSKNALVNPDMVTSERPEDFYHSASILCLQYDSEIMVTGSSDSTCIVWDINDDYRPTRRLHGHDAGVLDICFDDRYIISASKDTTICVWDRKTGHLHKKLLGHHGPVNAVQLRGDCVVSASGDGVAKLWNLTSGLCIKEFTSRNRGLACVEFSENARIILAGGNDQVIYEFDANSGELLAEMRGHTTLVRSLHLDSANKRIVSGSYDMSVKVFDAETGELSVNLPNWTTSWILSAKSDYRRIVATSQDARAVIMDFGYGLDGIEMLEA